MTQSIIVIGAGLASLAAGIYGQINGYRVHIFEQHTRPAAAARSLNCSAGAT